jgi:hypothetical protein
VAVHGRAVFAGTVNVTDVAEPAVTTAFTPFTSTLLSAIVAPKFAPLIVPLAPGTSVADDVPLIVGVIRLRTRRLTESVFPSAEARM